MRILLLVPLKVAIVRSICSTYARRFNSTSFTRTKIADCDRQILEQLKSFDAHDAPNDTPPANVGDALQRMSGVDLTSIGGKVLISATKAAALRMAAFTLFTSKSALGAYLRRQRSRLGVPQAITATAHKLARLVYAMLTHGTAYIDAGQEYYEKRYRTRAVQNLKRKAQALGFELVSMQEVATST